MILHLSLFHALYILLYDDKLYMLKSINKDSVLFKSLIWYLDLCHLIFLFIYLVSFNFIKETMNTHGTGWILLIYDIPIIIAHNTQFYGRLC